MDNGRQLNKWLNINENTIFENITNEYIFLENGVMQTHSIKYDALPDWFVAFDIFDKKENKFFSVQRRNEMIEKMGCIKYLCWEKVNIHWIN